MTKIYSSVVLTIASFAAQPVFADITAAELLAEWKENAEFTEMDMTIGSEVTEDGSILLTDLIYTKDVSFGTMQMIYPSVEIRELGDGRLNMVISSNPAMRFHSESEYSELQSLTLDLKLTNFEDVVVGTQKDHTHNFSVDNVEFDISLDMLEIPEDFEFVVKVEGYESTIRQVTDPIEEAFFEYNAVSELISTAISFSWPDEEISVSFNSEISDYISSSKQDMSPYFDQGDMLEHGLTSSSSVEFGNINFDFLGEGPALKLLFDGVLNSGGFSTDLTKTEYKFESESDDFSLNISLPKYGILDAGIVYDHAELMMSSPVDLTGKTGDARFRTGLTGLLFDEDLWEIIDPNHRISMEPASFILDMDGKVKLFQNIFAPDFDENTSELVGEVNAITVNELSANFAGVSISSVAGFDFDYDNWSMFEGFPQPIGTASFNLNGAFGLVNTLLEMGLLPSTAAFAVRTGIGTFAVRTGEEDDFISNVEFTDDGEIFVNDVKYK